MVTHDAVFQDCLVVYLAWGRLSPAIYERTMHDKPGCVFTKKTTGQQEVAFACQCVNTKNSATVATQATQMAPLCGISPYMARYSLH